VPGYLRGNKKKKATKRVVFAALLMAVRVVKWQITFINGGRTFRRLWLSICLSQKKKEKKKRSFASRSQTTLLSTRSLYTLFGFSFSFFSTWGVSKKPF
jgi:hypothetical protein